MIDFMVIGLPRSGTTWASNWLTTDETHCYHDPLYTTHYDQWDALPGRAQCGISCTGIWKWPDWVNNHPAKKLILHRSTEEINESMAAIGLPGQVTEDDQNTLESLLGLHMDFTELFNPVGAARAWKYLTGLEFNPLRHAELINIEMQPKFAGLSVGAEVTRQLREELACI